MSNLIWLVRKHRQMRCADGWFHVPDFTIAKVCSTRAEAKNEVDRQNKRAMYNTYTMARVVLPTNTKDQK